MQRNRDGDLAYCIGLFTVLDIRLDEFRCRHKNTFPVICCESYPRRFRLSIDFSHEINPLQPTPGRSKTRYGKAFGVMRQHYVWTSIRPNIISHKTRHALETLTAQCFSGIRHVSLKKARCGTRSKNEARHGASDRIPQMNGTRLEAPGTASRHGKKICRREGGTLADDTSGGGRRHRSGTARRSDSPRRDGHMCIDEGPRAPPDIEAMASPCAGRNSFRALGIRRKRGDGVVAENDAGRTWRPAGSRGRAVAQWSSFSTSSPYSFASSSSSSSARSLGRTRKIQPSPKASSLMVSGLSLSSSLTATTSPDTGE